ncbi:MAG: hypothetical protein PHG69_04550 [Candidatus Omnitrophica bacterium]|nr:hypothetical protein [Candidatus Omnitrophota bacterium]
MKYLHVILTVVVVFIGAISFRLMHISILMQRSNEQMQLLLDSNSSLINANKNLANEISLFKRQIAESGVNFIKNNKTK